MTEADTDARLDALTETLTVLVTETNNALRQVWAIRHERESHRLLVDDSSAPPDDLAIPHVCDDEPPEAR